MLLCDHCDLGLPSYVILYTLYDIPPIPHTLYIIHYTSHLRPTSHILHHTPYILHPTSYTLHHTPYILRPNYVLRCALRCARVQGVQRLCLLVAIVPGTFERVGGVVHSQHPTHDDVVAREPPGEREMRERDIYREIREG
jgi:hypothetical protein